MTNEEKDRILFEALEECWHDWGVKGVCLDTPEGFFWIWNKARKMKWWQDFKKFAWNSRMRGYVAHGIPDELVSPTKFRDVLVEFFIFSGRSCKDCMGIQE